MSANAVFPISESYQSEHVSPETFVLLSLVMLRWHNYKCPLPCCFQPDFKSTRLHAITPTFKHFTLAPSMLKLCFSLHACKVVTLSYRSSCTRHACRACLCACVIDTIMHSRHSVHWRSYTVCSVQNDHRPRHPIAFDQEHGPCQVLSLIDTKHCKAACQCVGSCCRCPIPAPRYHFKGPAGIRSKRSYSYEIWIWDSSVGDLIILNALSFTNFGYSSRVDEGSVAPRIWSRHIQSELSPVIPLCALKDRPWRFQRKSWNGWWRSTERIRPWTNPSSFKPLMSRIHVGILSNNWFDKPRTKITQLHEQLLERELQGAAFTSVANEGSCVKMLHLPRLARVQKMCVALFGSHRNEIQGKNICHAKERNRNKCSMDTLQ